jgi:hypothetical protein
MGVGLDGIVAKLKDLPHQSGERTGMQKVKKQRTAITVADSGIWRRDGW